MPTPNQPSDDATLATAVSAMVHALLEQFDHHMTTRGPFHEFHAGGNLALGDPATTVPLHVQMVVMAMDPAIEARFVELRFVSLRIMKSRGGGFVSLSCLHGTADELSARLEALERDPAYLIERIRELAQGLPQETNPDIWR